MARMSDIGGFLMRSQIQILALCVLSTLVHAANTGDGAEPITAPIHPREHDAVRSDRVLVALPDTVKQFFLATMRQNLSDISEIQRALAESDFERAERIAENNLGLGGITTHDTLAKHMPEEMRALGMEFHKVSSQLALSLKDKNMPIILGQLANVTETCVMCHAMYRVN